MNYEYKYYKYKLKYLSLDKLKGGNKPVIYLDNSIQEGGGCTNGYNIILKDNSYYYVHNKGTEIDFIHITSNESLRNAVTNYIKKHAKFSVPPPTDNTNMILYEINKDECQYLIELKGDYFYDKSNNSKPNLTPNEKALPNTFDTTTNKSSELGKFISSYTYNTVDDVQLDKLPVVSNISTSSSSSSIGCVVFAIFAATTPKDLTASYVYTYDIDGTIYFAVGRKIPAGGRLRIVQHTKTGAASTDEKYWGKWTNFGGGINDDKKTNTSAKRNSYLYEAVQEINDEAAVSKINRTKEGIEQRFVAEYVHVPWKPNDKTPNKLYLKLAKKLDNVAVFLFEMKDSHLFFNLFPKYSTASNMGRRGVEIVTSSYGEIDAVMSVSMQNIYDLQNAELIKSAKNNFFISYFCSTFNKIIKPYIEEESGKKHTDINSIADSVKRTPTELPVTTNMYKEQKNNTYII